MIHIVASYTEDLANYKLFTVDRPCCHSFHLSIPGYHSTLLTASRSFSRVISLPPISVLLFLVKTLLITMVGVAFTFYWFASDWDCPINWVTSMKLSCL